ncbi:hypothetical protein RJT34_22980 [Clitoria ternatea]|uniref:Uncharacterized protein n=1 Tax=Clitoria ternatea TaxID=43366 RepID=A0AAN9IGS6_CLITE
MLCIENANTFTSTPCQRVICDYCARIEPKVCNSYENYNTSEKFKIAICVVAFLSSLSFASSRPISSCNFDLCFRV